MKPADLQGFLDHFSRYNLNSLSRAMDNATAASTPIIGSNAPVSQYKIYKSHGTATSMRNEWFGTHHFDASNNAKCFLVVLTYWNESTEINGRFIVP